MNILNETAVNSVQRHNHEFFVEFYLYNTILEKLKNLSGKNQETNKTLLVMPEAFILQV